MSRRDLHLQRCQLDGKVRFRDKREATRALHLAAAARLHAEALGTWSPRQERRAYHCAMCQGWHLTSIAVWRDSLSLTPATDFDVDARESRSCSGGIDDAHLHATCRCCHSDC
jgi:hypothetical protein